MRPVIVTDGLWRKSLSAIRSLGKAGYPVTVMGDSWVTTGFWSAFTRTRLVAPTAAKNAEEFGAGLLRAIERCSEPPVLLPMEDPSLAWVVRNEDRWRGRAHCLFPPKEALDIAQDKRATIRVARDLGLPCPGTWEPESVEEFAKLAGGLEPGSFVVKPRSGTGSAGVAYGDRRDSGGWIEHWRKHGPMLVQERIPPEGRGQGVSLLMDGDSNCIAAFAHERLQQYPNSGGPSTDRQSIEAPELIERSIALLKALKWRGIAMVEWKIDTRDGVAKLMEINPRFWGSLELAVRAGVDFPRLYAEATMGAKAGPRPTYPPGVRCRWMVPGEILRYLTQNKDQREGLMRFLSGLPGLAEEWDWRDLRGTLSALVCTAALALNPRYWKYVQRG